MLNRDFKVDILPSHSLHVLTFITQEANAAKTLAVHEAEDSRDLWESEVKARSKLGLRVSGLAQGCGNSIANALELPQPCAVP